MAVEGIPAFQQKSYSPVPLFIPLGTMARPPHPYKLMSLAFTLRFIPAAGAGLIGQELSSLETVAKKQGPESSHAEPPAKRRRYFEPEDSDSDSESEEGFDLESYYDSATEDRTAEDVQKFISVAFKRCLSHQKRKELAREYPKPQVAKAPETDPLLADFLGKRYPEQQDKQLSRIQTSILAACAPLTDLWSNLCDQGLSGEEDELIPVEEVLKVIRASLALIGNSSNYVSQLRRKTIIEALPADKANLAKIMKQVCKRQIENSGSELFGDQAIKAVSERVNTLETFSKTASKSEVKLRQQPKRFFRGGPPAKYGGGAGTTGAPYIPLRDCSVRVSSRSQPRVFNPRYRTSVPFRKGGSSQLFRKPHTQSNQHRWGQPSQ